MNDTQNSNQNLVPPSHIVFLFIGTFIFILLVATGMMLLGGTSITLLSEALIILPAIIYVVVSKKSLKGIFRLKKVPVDILLVTVPISMAAFVITDELDRLINLVFPMPETLVEAMEAVLQINTIPDLIIIVLSAVILAGITEEMLFRGMLQQTLEYHRDPAMGIVLSAVIFGLIHFNPWTAIQIVVLGLILGYMAWKSNSIYPAVILHALNNLFSLILINQSEADLKWYSSGTHVNLGWVALSIPVLVFFLLQFKVKCDEFEQENTGG